jgi:hypothetical protein
LNKDTSPNKKITFNGKSNLNKLRMPAQGINNKVKKEFDLEEIDGILILKEAGLIS